MLELSLAGRTQERNHTTSFESLRFYLDSEAAGMDPGEKSIFCKVLVTRKNEDESRGGGETIEGLKFGHEGWTANSLVHHAMR